MQTYTTWRIPQGALVGAVHPFDSVPDPFAKPAQQITDELPVDVALGKLDYRRLSAQRPQIDGRGLVQTTNLGYELPAGAGNRRDTNYAAQSVDKLDLIAPMCGPPDGPWA